MRRHPAVSACAILARDERLIAYIVPNVADSRLKIADSDAAAQTALSADLRSFLAERLPDYMLPSGWVTLDALPLTPNGKLDHRALPAPDQARPEQQAGFVAPRTPTEATLAQVWAEVLGLERVGVRDDFFGLGGHSLSATRVIVKANQAMDVQLSVRMLFLQPTIEKLAATIDSARAVSASEDAVAQRIAELKARIAQLNAQSSSQ